MSALFGSGAPRSLSAVSLSCFPAAQMYRGPAVRPQQSPGAPRPQGRFPSPGACWGFPGPRSPYGSPGHRGGSPRGGYSPAYSSGSPAYSPGSPACSPGSNRGYSPGYRSFSPGGFRGGPRGFGGPMWRRGGGFPRRHSGGHVSDHKSQVKMMNGSVTCFVQVTAGESILRVHAVSRVSSLLFY